MMMMTNMLIFKSLTVNNLKYIWLTAHDDDDLVQQNLDQFCCETKIRIYSHFWYKATFLLTNNIIHL